MFISTLDKRTDLQPNRLLWEYLTLTSSRLFRAVRDFSWVDDRYMGRVDFSHVSFYKAVNCTKFPNINGSILS